MSAEPLEQALIPALPRPSLLVLRHARLTPHALHLTSPPLPRSPSIPLHLSRPPTLTLHQACAAMASAVYASSTVAAVAAPASSRYPFVICTAAQFTPMRVSQVVGLCRWVAQFCESAVTSCVYGVRAVSWGCVVLGCWVLWACGMYGDVRIWESGVFVVVGCGRHGLWRDVKELGVVCYGGRCGSHR